MLLPWVMTKHHTYMHEVIHSCTCLLTSFLAFLCICPSQLFTWWSSLPCVNLSRMLRRRIMDGMHAPTYVILVVALYKSELNVEGKNHGWMRRANIANVVLCDSRDCIVLSQSRPAYVYVCMYVCMYVHMYCANIFEWLYRTTKDTQRPKDVFGSHLRHCTSCVYANMCTYIHT